MLSLALCFLAALLPSVSVSGPAAQVSISVNAQPVPQYFVRVVQDGDDCEALDSVLPMCVSKDFVCRMEAGQEMFASAPSCLVYDPSAMQDNPYQIEETAAAPWANCDPTAEMNRQIGDAPACKRDFQCLCLHGSSATCVCAPPDAVSDENGAATCGNSATKGCDAGEYCHFLKEGGMECGLKPYFS
ncbi:hypothetical protein PHYBOEH_004592 [Phytophthora boehmeriae]|uniref:Uncharacterized protein n=1 Tax=Phytophthora boehmeriae TaxID=109152 RepID=A0A8T1WN76_9STRA|nr:hypothetical protein PHYBOEH_004592 [Phytophthora boehmeriae]